MKMKNLITICAMIFFFGGSALAQQDAMLTQYMFNGLYLNPAYAGSHEYWTSTFTYRSQWTGAQFDGAPQTAVAAVDGPIRGENMGLGFIFSHDRIGVTHTNTFLANYAYQLKFKNKSKLAFGLNMGVSQFDARLQDVLIWDEEDVVYESNLIKMVPRFGMGAYYFSDNYYVGLSVPTLIAYEDGNDFSLDVSQATFLRRHYLLTGGVVLPVSDDVKLKPSVLVKYVHNAPLEGDLNLSAVFKDVFWVGATYRTNDAVAVLVEYQSNSYFRFGYSYDITVSGLRGYQNGSHEIMIGVDFGKDLKKIKTPRYF